MKHRLILFLAAGLMLFSAGLPLCTSAQFPVFNTVAGRDQLNDGKVSRTIQDKQGLLWVGSNRGLFVYDGFGFREAELPDSLNLQEVTSLAVDHSGMIWAGFSNGSIVTGHEKGFVRFTPPEGLPRVPVTALLFEPDGTFWMATYGEGIYFYRDDRLFNINTDDQLGDNYIYTLALGDNGMVWAGNDAGISVCSAKGKKKVFKHYSTPEGLPDVIVQSITKARSGGYWIGMQEKGICYFNPLKESFEIPFEGTWSHGSVHALLDFGDLLWIATEDDGLVELPLKQGKSAGISMKEFTGKRAGCLIQDNEGCVWLVASGLLQWTPGPGLRHYRKVGERSFGNIHAIFADTKGSFWFGNDEGLYHYNRTITGTSSLKQIPLPGGIGNSAITSIYSDKSRSLWVGTFGSGLYRSLQGSNEMKRVTDPGGMLNDNILAISGQGSDIWLATLGGAFRCNTTSGADGFFRFDHFSSAEGLGNNYIYAVLADRNGRVWFGTDGKGAAMYEKGRFTGFGPVQGMPGKVIYSLAEDSDGNIWFGSAREGIYRYDGKMFTGFTNKSGLRDPGITSVAGGSQNQMIVVHNQGIDIINTRTGQVAYLGVQAGIGEINPDLNAVTTDSSGSVWIGTRDGIVHYTPEYLNSMAMPLTSIRRVSVYLSDEEALPGQVFPHNQNHLSFSYIGLWLSDPGTVTYRVKLEGNDPDWIYTGDRLATYSNLRPGSYTFRVQSSVNKDFTFAREATFHFSIKPPVYSRWWFVLGVLLLIIGLTWFFISTRIKRVRREDQLLREKAESQFQMLRSQVNPHFLFNNFSTLMAIIDEDKDLAIEYVGKLSVFFRYILEYRDKDLIPLSEELEIVDNYLFLQKKRYGDSLTVEKNITEAYLTSFIPPLTLQLLLENAVKHNIVSTSKPLNIIIYSKEELLVVENTLQPRKSPEPSTGMGLQNIRSRYKIFTSKEIRVAQTESLFSITLPLIFSKTKKP